MILFWKFKGLITYPDCKLTIHITGFNRYSNTKNQFNWLSTHMNSLHVYKVRLRFIDFNVRPGKYGFFYIFDIRQLSNTTTVG